MKYSYAIFDMDGLMFDTENLFVTSFETEVSRATGYRFEREQLKKLIGVNASRTRELFPQLFPGCPVSCDEAYAISHVWMQNYFDTHGVPVKPGLRELLDFLKANGCTCALATSSNRSVADYYLVGDLPDPRIGIGVHRDHPFGRGDAGQMLDGTGYPECQIHIRGYALSGLPHLTGLGEPPLLHQFPRA